MINECKRNVCAVSHQIRIFQHVPEPDEFATLRLPRPHTPRNGITPLLFIAAQAHLPHARASYPSWSQRKLLLEGIDEFGRLFCGLVDCDLLALGFPPELQLDVPLGNRSLAYSDARGDADKVGVLEFHAGPEAAVVVKDVNPGLEELPIEIVGDLGDLLVVLIHRRNHDFERRDRDGPDDPVLVVAQFDGGCENSVDPDPVAAHQARLIAALLVVECGAELDAVLRAQLEDLADLDALLEQQLPALMRIALPGVPDVGDDNILAFQRKVPAGDDVLGMIEHGR